jgi:hypothetical protein
VFICVHLWFQILNLDFCKRSIDSRKVDTAKEYFYALCCATLPQPLYAPEAISVGVSEATPTDIA